MALVNIDLPASWNLGRPLAISGLSFSLALLLYSLTVESYQRDPPLSMLSGTRSNFQL